MPSAIPNQHHKEIEEKGYTVVRNFLTPEEIDQYKKLSNKLIDISRAGNWPFVRINGKQFPPWDSEDDKPDIWGVTHLMHPDFNDVGGEQYQLLYSSEKLLYIVKDILQTDEINMELLNMLINPKLKNFDLSWHRDDIKNTATAEEEVELLMKNAYAGCQFNLALCEDECLIVVPKSHTRPRTDEEREKLVFEEISNQLVVKLNPGDIAFYNPNILHRATYNCSKERITIHGCYGAKQLGANRARLILQHGVGDWLDEFKPISPKMEELYSNLQIMSDSFKGVKLGYSLDG